MNGLTDVAGLRVGHYTDARRPTGCTVVIAPAGAVAGVDVRGAAPGTRETDLLAPINAVDRVHAVLLAGGSAFGLDAATGVMRWLEEREIGFEVKVDAAQTIRVPIVPAAILFDLWVGDPNIRPDAEAGYAACEAAGTDAVAEGNIGAGAGATVGKLFGPCRAMKGGLGSASITARGVTVAALVAVNAMGDVIDPATGRVVAGVRAADGRGLADARELMRRGEWPSAISITTATTPETTPAIGGATTLAIVATDAVITKTAASKIAQMAHDGLARTIDPVHTMSDGDVVFALGTGASGIEAHTTWLGALAADVLATAVLRAVRAARRIGGPAEPHLPDLPAANDA